MVGSGKNIKSSKICVICKVGRGSGGLAAFLRDSISKKFSSCV